MAYAHHDHDELVVADLVDDPIVPDANPPPSISAKHLGSVRARIARELVDLPLHTNLDRLGEIVQLLERRGRDPNLVSGHGARTRDRLIVWLFPSR